VRVKFSTLFLAIFTAVSATLLLAEAASFNASQGYQFRNTSSAFPTRLAPAWSLNAIQNTLLACDHAMSSPYSDFQIASDLRATASACAGFARRVISWAPTHGFALFVAAQAANIDGAPEIQASYLGKSQKFAPFEGWLAERRFALRSKQIFDPDVAPDLLLDAEMSTLLTTQSGAELLATFYLHRPELRTTLARIAGRSTAQNQTRFLNQLQQQAHK